MGLTTPMTSLFFAVQPRSINSSSNDDIDAVAEGMNRVDISDSNNDDTSEVSKETCAACGKEGNSDVMNVCNKCKSVKYCNAACKKKHRSKHKKACERRVAELYDEKLFNEVEPEECPICLLPLPIGNHTTYESCCGKVICNGCVYAMKMSEGGGDLYPCAFCRTPPASSKEEHIKRLKALMDRGNGMAFNQLAQYYYAGVTEGLPQDYKKANELFLKAGELGCSDGYFNLGIAYEKGRGVGRDEKKADCYFELATMGGDVTARYNLGIIEEDVGNIQRSLKHYTIAARAGHKKALNEVTSGFMNGFITKDEYANTLRAHHERHKEMKSDARDKAAALGMFSDA